MDQQTTIAQLRAAVAQFVARRNWEEYHNSKNLAISIAIESAELMEHFQWHSLAEAQALLADPAHKAEIAEELADVLIYCLSFANQAEIDISQAVLAKLDKNELRFPPGQTEVK